MDAADEMKARAWDALAHALESQNGQRPLFEFLRYPGNGMAKRAADELPEVQGWLRLAKKCPLGQKGVILYDPDASVEQIQLVQLLELNGDDLDATQCQITLGSPFVVPRDPAELAGENLQTVTGEFDNTGMSAFGDFPGTGGPVTWPPFLYLITWGIGGNRQRMYVDAQNGARVNVTCSYLSVIGAVAPDAVNQPGTAGAYVLAAFVGPGWPTPACAQRSIFVGALDVNDESDIFPTPLHAKRVTVIGAGSPPAMSAVPPVTVCYVRFFADPDGTIPVGNYIVNGNQPGPFPVPNAGMYFSIVSGMVSGTPFAGVFELAS